MNYKVLGRKKSILVYCDKKLVYFESYEKFLFSYWLLCLYLYPDDLCM